MCTVFFCLEQEFGNNVPVQEKPQSSEVASHVDWCSFGKEIFEQGSPLLWCLVKKVELSVICIIIAVFIKYDTFTDRLTTYLNEGPKPN